MKSTAINTLTYAGIVTLSQRIGDEKVKLAQLHNAGGIALFDFLADCLMGEFDQAKYNWPTKIKILEHIVDDETNTDDYISTSGFIYLNDAPVRVKTENKECRIRYSFLIPRDLIENISSFTNLGLGLYTHSTSEGDPANFAAFCSLSDVNSRDINNASLLIDWELVISNV